MGLCVLYYVEYSLYNVKKVGYFYLGRNFTLKQLRRPFIQSIDRLVLGTKSITKKQMNKCMAEL